MGSTRSPLQAPEIAERLRAQFGQDILASEDQHGHTVLTVTPERYHEIALTLRDDDEYACDYIDFISAVDRPDDGQIELVTHVYSSSRNHHVRLKVRVPRDDPRASSLSDVYPGANWHERETWELFGVVFEGHPHLVKLVLPEPFEGHPLRKDFALMSREAKPWPGAVEGEEIEDE